jgi:tetrahydromethanopterin S-methyltransferase subunit F
MNIADILRKVADIADQQADPGRPDDKIVNPAELSEVPTGPYGDGVEAPVNTDAGVDDEVMVPPLQLKLELLKRAVDVDNIYDNQRADEVHDNSEDPLAAIRRNAGIDSGAMTAIIHGIAGADEPLDD